jgi:uronate dehydrogenase
MIVLITGAAGVVGTMLTEPLQNAKHVVRRTDLNASDASAVEALDVTDPAAVAAACVGVDAIVHLAGIASEAGFDAINRINVGGTQNILAGAVAAGVKRVILASSNHAVGFHRRSELPEGVEMMDDPTEPRPDTYYGWSKVGMEALGSLFHDRFGLEVIALRIGSCFPEPTTTRMLATWLSPADVGPLVNACLSAPDVGYQAIWAISANTRRWWSLAAAEALGFRSVDNAERFADQLISRLGEPDRRVPEHDRVGGAFCAAPLGEVMAK